MAAPIDLGGITPDARYLVRQLRHDLKDDWYPDPLGYEDLLLPERVAGALAGALARSDGLFPPEKRTELDIPKPRFILRYSLETSLIDRAYYHALAAHLLPYYDQLLPPNVLSYRCASQGSRAGRYLFVNPIEQWKHFHAYVRQALSARPVVLASDVHNYYENIRLEALLHTLRSRVPDLSADAPEKVRIRFAISELERCLRSWCYSSDHGLPQNRDASSILGNIMLLPVDEAMLGRGYAYFRYMDDIRIATESRYRARAALRDLIMELRKIGLNVNASKTHILEPGTEVYKSELLVTNRDLDQIDIMWSSRSLPVIRRSFEPLRRLAERLIHAGRMDDKAFRFCIRRFANLALCEDIDIPPSFFANLTDAAIRELDAQPWASDQIVRFLKAAPSTPEQISRVADLLVDKERALYDWQNYLLWQLLVYKRHREPRLLVAARNRSGDLRLHADRAGAMLYVGALGESADRERIAQSFSSCSGHLLQRAALIAVHELDYSPVVKTTVQPHVLPSLRGTYQEIRNRYRGVYHLPLPAVRYTEIFDELSPYD